MRISLGLLRIGPRKLPSEVWKLSTGIVIYQSSVQSIPGSITLYSLLAALRDPMQLHLQSMTKILAWPILD